MDGKQGRHARFFFRTIDRILWYLLRLPDTDHVKQKNKNHEITPSRFFPDQKTKRSFVLRHTYPVHEVLTQGAFHLTKFRFEISKILRAQWYAHLVIVLVRIQKSGTGDNDFVKRKGAFPSDRPKSPHRSKWTTFKAGPDVPTEISGILG